MLRRSHRRSLRRRRAPDDPWHADRGPLRQRHVAVARRDGGPSFAGAECERRSLGPHGGGAHGGGGGGGGGVADDFFGSPSAAPAASAGPIGIDEQTKVHMTAWFKGLTVNTTGLLFENQFIQLFLQQDYRGSQARIDFMVKSKGQAMQNITAQIDSAEIGANALRSQMQTAQPVLEANGQFTVRLMVECMTPFSGTPSFDLKFSIGTQSYAYAIPIPSIVTKFVEPVQMSGADLNQRWDGMSAPQLQVMEVFQAKNAINTVAMPNLVAAATKMAVAQDLLQANPNVIMAAGTLKTGTLQQGNPGKRLRLDA